MKGLIHIVTCTIYFLLLLSVQTAVYAQSTPSDSVNVAGDSVKIDIDKLPPYRKDRRGDPFTTGRPSPLLLPPSSKVKTDISIDTSGNYYNVDEKMGDMYFREPSRLGFDDYKEYRYKETDKEYWDKLSFSNDRDPLQDSASSGKLIPDIHLGPVFNRLFGGDKVEIQPNGSVLLDFGGLWQRVENPQLPIRQQTTGGFNFDQQIQMNLVGKIGDKFAIGTNFDTKNTFQYEQRYKMGYSAYEQDIIQEVNLGNVSFNTSNSLIRGAQNLFGVQTKMRFGKLWINAMASSNRGTSESITIRNGAQGREFTVRGSDYVENQYFFLSEFFRGNYEKSLATLPNIGSGVTITRVEVYVTNRALNTDKQRNITAFLDLGDQNPFNSGAIAPGSPVRDAPSRNEANNLFSRLANDATVRNPDQVVTTLEGGAFGLANGSDFELIRRARKLTEQEYKFHPQLGYISLRTPIQENDVLAVAFEYTYNGVKYKVGELTEDYQARTNGEIILLKMLSPSSVKTDLPTWDLMMKNVYSLNATMLRPENFQLRVIYRDDATGIDNPSLHEGRNTKDVPLVQLVNADNLNPNGDRVVDGNFDYIKDVTISEERGRVIFPVLEPFGSQLDKFFEKPDENDLVNKYVFRELYNTTKNQAKLNASKDKYFLMGTYQSGTSNEIKLPGINIAPNSVVITAGGSTLQEGSQYTVDYQFGIVRITDEAVLASGKEIRIQYERADLFSFQTRNLVGVDLEYHLNKNVKFSTTLMQLSERPIISRVSVGQEPMKNTLWGAGVDYKGESKILTKAVDLLPGISTREISNVTAKVEFAQLLPSSPDLLGPNGTSYIDDFEASEIPYDFTRSPLRWTLGSIPKRILDANPSLESLAINNRRAKLAWYNIDNIFYFSGGTGGASRPGNITDEDLENHYERLIPFDEVFPNRQRGQVITNEVSFDMAYYPDERGPYNYNTADLLEDGTLRSPENNFAAITRPITSNVDFDNINIQYVEFWLMDPFLDGDNGKIKYQRFGNNVEVNNTTGGDLYINLGNISEDLLPDNSHMFENGINGDVTPTTWGAVPSVQYLNNAFDNNTPRGVQDVGFDGIGGGQEFDFYSSRYLNQLPANLNPAARATINGDPSGDNFRYYLDGNYDATDAKILERYRLFNGVEGNSPASTGGAFTPSSTNIPDNEDLDRDNTVSSIDQYYEMKVSLEKGMDVSNNPYIANKIIHTTESGETVTWYQFRVPIRGSDVANVGGIEGYKSIRFMRMYMTNWRQPVVLRMVNFCLVGAQWRPYTSGITSPGGNLVTEAGDADPVITTVNIESNGNFDGENTPYTLPPGFERDYDATSQVTRQLNEQSIQVCADLGPRKGAAIYKNVAMDFFNYGRIQLELHGESEQAVDEELTAFLRIGTDFDENYYEIEVPLKLTPRGSTDPSIIWPQENKINVSFDELLLVKAKRNRQTKSYSVEFEDQIRQYKVKVKGRPDFSSVQLVMIGVRNTTGTPKDLCIWANELRVSEFDNTPGWATNATVNAQLADLMAVNTAVRYSTVGFGGVQDKLKDRQRSDNLDFDIATNINLDKFFLHKLGITLPLYLSFETSEKKPFYDPLDPDTPLEISLQSIDDPKARQEYQTTVKDLSVRRAINFSGIKKVKVKEDAKSYPWDVENLTLSLSYNDHFRRDIRTHSYDMFQWKIGLGYGYSPNLKPLEPFKESKSKLLDKKGFQLIKDFNLNPLPTSFTFQWGLDRRFAKTQLRNSQLSTDGILPTYEKSFNFNRNYNLQWSLSKNLGLDYSAQVRAIVDEPTGEVQSRAAQDSIMKNLQKFGRNKNYSQTVGANYIVPLKKIPGLDWINADTRYAGGYDWIAGPIGMADTLGHRLSNRRNISINTKFGLKKLYDKVPYLKRIQKRKSKRSNRPPTVEDPLKYKKERLEKRVDNVGEKLDKKGQKAQKKEERRKPKEEKKKEKTKKQKADFEKKLQALAAKAKERLEKEAQEKLAKREAKIAKLNAKDTTGEASAKFIALEDAKDIKLGQREQDKKVKAAESKKRKDASSAKKVEKWSAKGKAVKVWRHNAKRASTKVKAERRDRIKLAKKKGIYNAPGTVPSQGTEPDVLTRLEKKESKLNAKVEEVTKKMEFNKKHDIKPSEHKVVKGALKAVMGFKDVNVSYSVDNTTALPGYTETPRFLAFDQNWQSPGLPFIVGNQDPNIRHTLGNNGWLSTSEAHNSPFTQTASENLKFRTQYSAIKDLKISLEASKRTTSNYTEVYKFSPEDGMFESQGPMRTGSYTTSFISIGSAFRSGGEDILSPVFEEFSRNRFTIKDRLDGSNPNLQGDTARYNLNSLDVLIPAFLAAYGGQSASAVQTTSFPAIPLPNWRVTYTGLSRIESLKKIFSSISINHSYKSEYSVGSFTSSLAYGANDLTLNNDLSSLGPAKLDSGKVAPMLVVNQVQIRENFSPLIGVSIRTKSNISLKMNYNKRRDVALNLANAQIREVHGNDVSIDVGYTKAGLKLPFLKTRGGKTLVMNNDVTFRLAFTIRDTKTIQRKLDEPDVVTAGNINLQVRPTISYVLNKRANLQLYFERAINTPRTSNAFRRTNTAFGVQFRFSLTE